MKQEKSSLIQFEKASRKKISFESLVSTQLEPLKSAGGGKREISALAKALGAFEGFDASLLQALSTVLAKPADQHSSFDQIVIKQLDEALSDVKGKLDAELEVVDADKMEKASSKDAAQAARNKAKEAYDNAHSDHEEAVEARAGAKKALQEAENAQNSYDADMREVASALDAANEALVTFKNGPVERFTCLRDKETPAEPPMEVTLPEEEVPAPAKDSVAEAAAE
jgi:chromosome segregation ATPase